MAQVKGTYRSRADAEDRVYQLEESGYEAWVEVIPADNAEEGEEAYLVFARLRDERDDRDDDED